MRVKISMLSFVVALAAGVSLALIPSVADRLWPSFSKEEATCRVGRRVSYRQTEKFKGMKCPQGGFCREISAGEPGTIVGIEKVADGGYFLLVRWDEPGGNEDYLSYFGRFTHRESLVEE